MNVLFACLSMLNTGNMKIRDYSDENGNIVQGIMTNEAPARATIDLLNQKGQKLDRIVVICSQSVREKKLDMEAKNRSGETLRELLGKMIEKDEEAAGQRNQDAPMHWELFGGGEHIQPTTYEIYQELINCHARSVDPSYSSDIYRQVKIDDDPKDDSISETVIEAATEITNADEPIHLYIDYNGGQRYIALMMLAIANLMKNRSVNIEQIMTMNSNSLGDPNAIIPIQNKNMESIFDSFDLVSGINEFINYGRITGLTKYFDKPDSQDKERKEILDKMKEFSDNLQLCRTDNIMDSLAAYDKYKHNPEEHKQEKVLWIMLDEYVKNHKSDKNKDSYAFLFYYVIEDILNGYDKVRNGELPEIIEWCIDHDFVQQALTFCSEEMPGYFWRSGIFKASPDEKREYDRFLEKIHTVEGQKSCPSLKNKYRVAHEDGSSKYAYEWMTYYLPFSATRDKESYALLLADEDDSYKFGPEKKDREATQKELLSLINNNPKLFHPDGVPLDGKQIENSVKAAASLVWQVRQRRRVSSTISDNKLKIKKILIFYQLLKTQRNKTNHADDTDDECIWSCAQICYVLKGLVRTLQGIDNSRR